ncbi:hypothetical protein OG747_25710 [Streptomyces sp. NBC_01384]|uniref:hypothetical protein n=1 Tax=Streptomyces sp. NBC_01384 TaxID=2903847 RepID=UPI003247069D
MTAVAPAPTGVAAPALVLPMPGEPLPAKCRREDCEERLRRALAALRETLAGHPPTALRPPADEVSRVRYRWLIGHHAAFGVWQSLARVLHALTAASEAAVGSLTAWAAALYDTYSVLFLYAGSCTPELYAAMLRPHMTAAHPAFSGEWSRDHASVRAALRAARDQHSPARIAPLTRAVKDNRRVHMAVAGTLVPGGASLLQQSGRHPGHGPTEDEQALYDDYFHVQRQPLCRVAHWAQLVRVLGQCTADIAGHGLGLAPEGCPERFTRDALELLTAPALAGEPPLQIHRPPKGRKA